MELPVGRRKSLRVSLFTSLVEGEATQLSRDFHSLCSSEFPAREMALVADEERGSTREQRIQAIAAARYGTFRDYCSSESALGSLETRVLPGNC